MAGKTDWDKKAQKLGHENLESFIRSMYPTHSVNKMAKMLGCHGRSLNYKMHELEIELNRPGAPKGNINNKYNWSETIKNLGYSSEAEFWEYCTTNKFSLRAIQEFISGTMHAPALTTISKRRYAFKRKNT